MTLRRSDGAMMARQVVGASTRPAQPSEPTEVWCPSLFLRKEAMLASAVAGNEEDQAFTEDTPKESQCSDEGAREPHSSSNRVCQEDFTLLSRQALESMDRVEIVFVISCYHRKQQHCACIRNDGLVEYPCSAAGLAGQSSRAREYRTRFDSTKFVLMYH